MKELNESVSGKIAWSSKAARAHLFVSDNVFSLDPVPLPNIVDATDMLSQLNNSEIMGAWQAYLDCKGCAEKRELERNLSVACATAVNLELSEALSELGG